MTLLRLLQVAFGEEVSVMELQLSWRGDLILAVPSITHLDSSVSHKSIYRANHAV
jgi:hypothetical protein